MAQHLKSVCGSRDFDRAPPAGRGGPQTSRGLTRRKRSVRKPEQVGSWRIRLGHPWDPRPELVLKIWMPLVSTGTGAETYADRLKDLLAARGHDVSLDKVAHRFQYAPWLARLRPPDDAEVVFANSWSASGFARNIPLVTVVHHVAVDPAGDPFKSLPQRLFHHFFVKRMERSAIRRSRRVIAVSRTTADAIRNYLLPCVPDIVPPGIDTDFFSPGDVRELRSIEDPVRLLFVGKPSFRKGFDIVDAVVERMGRQVELTCVGDPPPRGVPRPNARYLGRVSESELRDCYRSADLLMFPSRLEGFGYVAAEALACGLPVVCTEGTAVEETCGTGSHSLRAPPGDIEGFCEVIRSAWAAEPGLAKTRVSARKWAKERFSNIDWAEAMEQIFIEAARESAGGHAEQGGILRAPFKK